LDGGRERATRNRHALATDKGVQRPLRAEGRKGRWTEGGTSSASHLAQCTEADTHQAFPSPREISLCTMSSTVNPALVAAPGPTLPAGGLFSTGLMTAILGGTVPSVVDGALNPTQQTPGPMVRPVPSVCWPSSDLCVQVDTTAQVTANNGGSSSAAVGTTQGAAADAVSCTFRWPQASVLMGYPRSRMTSPLPPGSCRRRRPAGW
jgi:hypothetical protein